MTSIPNSIVASDTLWLLPLQLKQLFTFSVVLLVAKSKQRNPSAVCVGRETTFFLVKLKILQRRSHTSTLTATVVGSPVDLEGAGTASPGLPLPATPGGKELLIPCSGLHLTSRFI